MRRSRGSSCRRSPRSCARPKRGSASRQLPLLLAVALAGCGGSTRAHDDATAPARRTSSAFERIVSAFDRHGETLAIEPDLTGDDFVVSWTRRLPQPVVLLSRRDGDPELVVYVYRSPTDARAVATVPRRDLVFRPEWNVLHRSNVLVITLANGARRAEIAAALADYSTSERRMR